mgnify:CR=1 FL=1
MRLLLPCDSNQFRARAGRGGSSPGTTPSRPRPPWASWWSRPRATTPSTSISRPASAPSIAVSRDSGAIIVGAADPDFAPGSASRVTAAASIFRDGAFRWSPRATAICSIPATSDNDTQRFFSGTSSASPIVTGASAALQGVRTAAGFPPYTPAELRQLLRATGTPQFVEPNRIGPRPNLGAARTLAAACGNNVTDPDEACDDGNLISGDGLRISTVRLPLAGTASSPRAESCDDGNVVGVTIARRPAPTDAATAHAKSASRATAPIPGLARRAPAIPIVPARIRCAVTTSSKRGENCDAYLRRGLSGAPAARPEDPRRAGARASTNVWLQR